MAKRQSSASKSPAKQVTNYYIYSLLLRNLLSSNLAGNHPPQQKVQKNQPPQSLLALQLLNPPPQSLLALQLLNPPPQSSPLSRKALSSNLPVKDQRPSKSLRAPKRVQLNQLSSKLQSSLPPSRVPLSHQRRAPLNLQRRVPASLLLKNDLNVMHLFDSYLCKLFWG
jgi:hypothetical protein